MAFDARSLYWIPTVTVIPDSEGFVAIIQWLEEESGLTGSWSVGPVETVDLLLSAVLALQEQGGWSWYWLHRAPHIPRLVIPELPTPVQATIQAWATAQSWAVEIAPM